jgi:hypothetical protein
MRLHAPSALFVLAVLLPSTPVLDAATVAVRTREGLVHGFLSLRVPGGKVLADGDLFQVAEDDRVTTRLQFRFKDGSFHEETTVYTQSGHFRLVSDRVVQKGPAFPRSIDSKIDASGHVTVRYAEDGKEKQIDEHMELPDDLANGLVLTLLKNLDPKAATTTVSMLAIQPKLRLVKLEVTPSGEEPFTTGGTARKAMHYVVKVDVGGVTGVLADLLDKTPPDSHVFVLTGEAPAFVRSQSPLYVGGPLWEIELVSPEWKR